MRLFFHLLIGCALGALLMAAPAGPPHGIFRFSSYGVDQGLTNLSVLALAQDQDGSLWVGTEDGVFRYGGQRFVKFGTEEGLPSPSTRQIRVTSDGWVWVDTEQGLARGRVGERFQAIGGGPQSPGDSQRQAMAVDGSEGLWVGDATGLWYTRGTEAFRKVEGAPQGPVEALWVDDSGQRLVIGRTGSLDIRDANGRWTHLELPKAFHKVHPQGLLLDRQGRIWVRSFTWLLRFPAGSKTPENLTHRLPGGVSQWADVMADGPDRVWAPTNQGVLCFEGDQTWLLGEAQGLESPSANTILVDREGSLWVASEGLHRLAGRLAWTFSTRRQGLPHDTAWSVRRSRSGNLYVGTLQGLAVGRGERWAPIPATQGRTIYALGEDAQGRVIAGGTRAKGASGNSLFLQDGGPESFREIPLSGIQNSVGTLAGAPDGSLWAGTVSQGLFHLRLEDSHYRCKPIPLPGGNSPETIHQILLDAQGLPVLSGTKGLAWFDGQAWHRFGKAQGLLDDHPGTLAIGPDGSLWVAYWEVHGLTRLRKTGTTWSVVEHLASPPELTADTIYSLGVDPRGTLWMGCTFGIRRWDGKQLEHFTHHEGLPGNDTSGNAMWIDPDGDAWVGMTAGLAHFEARRHPGPAKPSAMRLETFRDGTDHALVPGPEAVLPYRSRTVAFTFAVESILQEVGTHSQVRLVGFEDEWRDSQVFQARYTGLPAGSYRFEVRGHSREGLWGPVLSQPFRILPPWWQRWWAIGLGLLGLGGLLALIIRWRTAVIKRHLVEMEALVQERTWNLEDANAALSKANAALEEASMVDPLTGLKNRRFLGLSLPEEVARVLRACHRGGAQPGQELAFLLIDLDHFKAVNDTYGHGAGDAVLQQTGALLRRACRESDTVVRWGGEEFLVVAKATGREHAETIARHIQEEFHALAFDLPNGEHLPKTCSIGFSAFPVLHDFPEAFRWEEAVEVADQCLYAAKKSGRDAYVGIWAPHSSTPETLDGRLLKDLPGLVEEGVLQLRTSFPQGHTITW